MTEQNFTAEELKREIWKPVLGFEGHYEVSNLGRVRTLKNSHGNPLKVPVIKSTRVLSSGYPRVILCNRKKKKTFRVHILVAGTFIGNPPEGKVVNHKDTDKTNNRLANLEYLTPQENNIHAIENGIKTTGEAHYAAKLTNLQVEEIRRLLAKNVQAKEIAERFNVTQGNISYIKSGKSRKHG